MGRLQTRHGPVVSNPPWACLRIRHKRLRPVPLWQLQPLGCPVWRIRHTTPNGPPWLADLGLRRWYTYLVYPQHTRLANSKISWTEIQFASSKLTAAMRESSSGCKDDEDTPVRSTQPRKQRQRKNHTSASIRASNSTKEGKGMVCTSSKSRHFITPFSHGLFPLDVLLISVRKGLLRFICPSQC
jgi:hypothetical protein